MKYAPFSFACTVGFSPYPYLSTEKIKAYHLFITDFMRRAACDDTCSVGLSNELSDFFMFIYVHFHFTMRYNNYI